MAIIPICAALKNGYDLSCTRPTFKAYQQLVLINKADIDTSTIVAPWTEGYNPEEEDCAYYAQFELSSGKTGFRFTFPEKGSAIYGSVDSSSSDNGGYSLLVHHVNALVASSTEAQKCVLDSIIKGSFVAALQLHNGDVEIYGLQNGLYLDDVTIDAQSNGGVTPIVLSSMEGNEESTLPLTYRPQNGGDAIADFDSNFANTGS